MPPVQRGRLAPYKAALEAISSRTRTPLSSLVLSFAILHEVTAIAPLISVFFMARSFGVGENAVNFIKKEVSEGQPDNDAWLREKGKKWMDEGEKWAAKVGHRYGIFGFPKTPKGSEIAVDSAETYGTSTHLAGDVANAVLAYGVTKSQALLPARIGLSLYLAPTFSRRMLDPLRQLILSRWSRKS
ncbi:hypothetical protein Clacol_008306 [Clathrus columnatus]|uniref:Uncharacterized protein n=1 Tax=Clathrus columnatus TaxID=1419009 RepID=A0AAV5AMV2_9AGAM|nr:hypothetical protein Clacol_008306 [Clathrus columnatus]